MVSILAIIKVKFKYNFTFFFYKQLNIFGKTLKNPVQNLKHVAWYQLDNILPNVQVQFVQTVDPYKVNLENIVKSLKCLNEMSLT